MLTVMNIFILTSLISVNEAATEVAAQYGEPEIYSFSWGDYCGQGMNNFEIKMLMVVYLDSLDASLDSLYSDLHEMYSIAPELQEDLEVSHNAFLEYCESWASLSEERMWWNLEDGIRNDGTARGYTYAYTLAKYRWQKIVAYTRMLDSSSPWDDSPDPGMLGLQDIGGYYP